MHFKIMAAAVLSVLAAPAFAQNNDATVAPKPEKKICRRVEVTGSIIGSKAVCHTKAEWAAIDDANAKAAGDSLARQRDARPSRPEG
jgi:hypothetical protein